MSRRAAIVALVLAAMLPRTLCSASSPFFAVNAGLPLAVPRVLTNEDVDAWLDGLLPYALHNGAIAGAVVIVVKDGQVLTERGYGYADVAGKKPMDPRLTLIRPGSVSKLLTWTAVMQLVERGALDLDADVNRYLDLVIPPLDGKPITLRNIMTHTSGFEESLKDLAAGVPPLPLADYIKLHLPLRVYPPGQIPSYSNYASALAGYIVQRASRQPFETYIEGQILAPLGMNRSSFRQPLPPDLQSRVSNGYSVASKPPGYYEYFGPAPAGAMATTADDMGKFMLAHLQNGGYGERRILSEETAVRMHAAQPKIYPALNAMALGFYEASRNGHRIIAHNGGTQFFHSDLHLFIDDGVGIFISLNSVGAGDAAIGLLDAVFHGFADRYFPASSQEDSAPLSLEIARPHARLIAGTWEDSRGSASTFLSIAGFLNAMTVTANEDGTVNVPIPSRGTLLFHETAPFVWVSGAERIQALVSKGRPVMLGFDMAPPAAFLRQPWQRSAAWLNPALVLALAVSTITAVSWPVAAIARRLYHVAYPLNGRRALLYKATRAAAVAILVTTLMFGVALIYLAGDLSRMSGASDGWMLALETGALIIFPGATLVSAWNLRWVWREGRNWLARAGSIAFLASCCVTLWSAITFHLMALRTHY
jgi:CubicO group peptidase (beta-lactamase class C family)